MEEQKQVIFTIGYLNRTLASFIELLHSYNVERLIDIRPTTKSTYSKHFDKENLSSSLSLAEIEYKYVPQLGQAAHYPENSCVKDFLFHMQTPTFKNSMKELKKISKEKQTAIMCAEPFPWQCHRYFICDVLSAQNIAIQHIVSSEIILPHILSPNATIKGRKISYKI